MITFANGKNYDTIGVYLGETDHQNARRRTLDILISHEKATFDELAELYADPSALDKITTEDGGSQNVHLHYTLPISLGTRSFEGAQVWSMKVAEMSALEIAQKQQAENIAVLDAAVMEIGEIIGGEM